MMKNIKGLSGAIYNTEYAMICQPMTRIDTSFAVCFFLLLFAVKIRQCNGNETNYCCGQSGE